MLIIPTKKLRDGSSIPLVGMGTGIIRKRAKNLFHFLALFIKEKAKNVLIKGFKKNNRYPIYRDTIRDKKIPVCLDYFLQTYCPCYFDTARAYSHSEEILGNILGKSQTNRGDLFIVSKIRNTDQTKQREKECVEESLTKLKTNYLDLLLLHWPQTDTFVDSYRRILRFQEKGLTKGIGVANFNIHHLEELVKNGLPLPLVNEVECHPYYQQKALIDYCNQHEIQVIAYTPTGRKMKEFSTTPSIQRMCEKYGAEPIEIIMSWHRLRGVIPVFSTTSKKHLNENIKRFIEEPVPLTSEELKAIAALDRGEKFFPDPDNCDFSKL